MAPRNSDLMIADSIGGEEATESKLCVCVFVCVSSICEYRGGRRVAAKNKFDRQPLMSKIVIAGDGALSSTSEERQKWGFQ